MKFCKDCKHCKITVVTVWMGSALIPTTEYLCMRPKLDKFNMVTGVKIPSVVRKCSVERNSPGWCGEDGYYFRGKQNEQPTQDFN